MAEPQPYHLAFRVTLEDGAHLADPNADLHYTFAAQSQYQGRALECWDLAKRLSPMPYIKQLKYIGFDSPDALPQLQAADLYARCWYNYFVRGTRLNRENWTAMTMLNAKRSDLLYCDAASMENLFRSGGITNESRELMRTSDRILEEGRAVLRRLGLKVQY